MNVKKYFALTAKEVLYKVRNDLGADAVIVSSRSVNGGHEIMAVCEIEIENLVNPTKQASINAIQDAKVSATKQVANSLEHRGDANQEKSINKNQATTQMPENPRAIQTNETLASQPTKLQQKAQKVLSVLTSKPQLNDDVMLSTPEIKMGAVAQHASTTGSTKSHQQQNEMLNVMREIKSMRSEIEKQLYELNWLNTQRHEPMKKTMLQIMLKGGFSLRLARNIAQHLPAKLTEKEATQWLGNVIKKNLASMNSDSDLIKEGGIYALIGPTGVGKTTTTAKIAAKFVMQHGAQKLSLISTDAYRVGGHEQLRIYGKILGVMVHAVKDESDLKLALSELKHKHTILIDTVGMSQKDQMVSAQISMLSQQTQSIKKILCLNATSGSEHLSDVVSAYRKQGLAGCIMTKTDEASSLGAVVDVMMQEKLKVYYLTNGQRVPEDIHVLNKEWLVHQLFNTKHLHNKPSYEDEELALVATHHSTRANGEKGLELNYAQ